MNKWYGNIGYADYEETAPGVWEEVIKDRKYYGDILRNVKNNENSQSLNDNIIFSLRVSVVADPFILENFPHIKYIEIFGNKWKISSTEIAYPRITLTTGGLYNEQTENGTTDDA